MKFSYLDTLKNKALELAKRLRHAKVTIEHLLLVLVESDESDVVRALTYNPYHEYDRDQLIKCLKQGLQACPPLTNDGLVETLGFQRVLTRTERMVEHKERRNVNGADVLLAIFHEQESQGAQCLRQCQATRADIESYLSQPRFKEDTQHQRAEESLKSFDIQTLLPPPKAGTSAGGAEDYLENLNMKYRQGKLSPVIGRQKEIQETMMILSQSRKSNPLLIGEPGVGKTTIAVGLAQLIEEQKVPMSLRNATIYSLKLTALMAGTQFRGEFEKRMDDIINFLKQTPHAILFIDEIHMIIGAGSTKGSDMDMANILKPALASGEISCIGATTYKEFRQIFEKDEALKRRFAEVHVPEPTPEEALAIIQGMKPRLEKHHRVVFDQKALEISVTMSQKYIKDRRLPDIALDVLDEAGALVNMENPHLGNKIVDAAHVYQVIASKAHIPVEQIAQTQESAGLAHLTEHLKEAIFGQDHAIETLVAAVTMANAGLRDSTKPIGSFLFAGPTGVGKTELCKQLALQLGMKLLRFDMSEYTDQSAYTKLIGTAPGYVGYDQGGILTDAVQKEPHSIVLMDEIEKAHPQIYNLLLQVLDYGTLTDGQARKVDFRHTIIVLTTNAGAAVFQKRSIGFGGLNNEPDKQESQQEMARVFSPEFRNRFDEIIQFNALPKSVAGNIVDKLIAELQQTLINKKVKIILTDSARQWLIDHGYDAQMGARPMGRLVTNELKKPLAKELLYGHLKNGGQVTVDAKHGELTLNFN